MRADTLDILQLFEDRLLQRLEFFMYERVRAPRISIEGVAIGPLISQYFASQNFHDGLRGLLGFRHDCLKSVVAGIGDALSFQSRVELHKRSGGGPALLKSVKPLYIQNL